MSSLQRLLLLLSLLIGPYSNSAAETVIANGLGQDLDAAIQNSAENALTQLVGSFLDANTTIEKHTEIRDAVKQQSKTISSRASEYSQGTIERIEVIDKELDGPFVRVTSRVTVRMEEFQAYLKRSAVAETSIDEGLFAQMQVQKDQEANLADIIVGRVFSDIFDLGVIRLSVDSVTPITDPSLAADAADLLRPESNESLLAVGISAEIDPDFLGNAFDTFSETASRGLVGGSMKAYCQSQNPQSGDMFFWVFLGELLPRGSGRKTAAQVPNAGTDLWEFFGSSAPCADEWSRGGLSNYRFGNIEASRWYVFPIDKASNLCEAADRNLFNGSSWPPPAAPTLELTVLDKNKSAIVSTFLVQNEQTSGFVSSELAFILNHPETEKRLSRHHDGAQAINFISYRRRGRECVTLINTASTFQVVLKLRDEQLARAHSVQVALQR